MAKEENTLIGKNITAVPKEAPEIGIDTDDSLTSALLDSVQVGQVNLSSLENFSTVAQTREQDYGLIDIMSQDSTIASVLETYTEDIIDTNDKGQVVWCESSDDECAKYVTYLLESLNVDKNAYSWFYSLVKYGDLYLQLYRESDYANDPLFGNQEDKKSNVLNEDLYAKINKKNDHYVPYVEKVANPCEMFELTKFGKTVGYIKAPTNPQRIYSTNSSNSSAYNNFLTYRMNKGDVTVYNATDFVHICLEDTVTRTPEMVDIFVDDDAEDKTKSPTASYRVRRGQSLLANVFKIWRELSLLENSVLLNRITRSSIVRILNVNIGDMPKEQINDFMARLKSKIEQKQAINSGNSMSEYTNPGPMENIIYIPTHGENGQGNIVANTIGDGEVNVSNLADLDWFSDKLYGAVRIPKQYLGKTEDGAGFNGGASLTIISSRYGKAIKKLQNIICQGITDLVNLFLIDRGMQQYVNKFRIRMQQPVTQEEIDKKNNITNSTRIAQDTLNILSDVEDKSTRLKITKSLLSSFVSDNEILSLIQGEIDKLEEEPEEQKEEEDKGDTESKSIESEPSPMPTFSRSEEPSFEEPEETSEIGSTGNENESETSEEDSYLPSFAELNVNGLEEIQ